MFRYALLTTLTICGVMSLLGQNVTDSSLIMSYDLEEVEVVQNESKNIVEQQGSALVVDMQQLDKLPRFLGTSDPLRYLQSLPGITTNNETRAGIHLQGCDDYQTWVGINGAPVIYPNHLMGLFSTFISPHFSLMKVEHDAHLSSMPNRVGGLIEMHTKHVQPQRFGAEGSVGLIASDLTLTIPCGKKSAFWLSARASYPVLKLYEKIFPNDGLSLNYYFMDYNLSYAYHPTNNDELVATAFYSRDRTRITSPDQMHVNIAWQNLVGSVYYNRHTTDYHLRSTLSFSGFDTRVGLSSAFGNGNTQATMATTEWKNKFDYSFSDQMNLSCGLDYVHYFFQPLNINVDIDGVYVNHPNQLQHADEVNLYADWKHDVSDWFNYTIGLRGSIYHQGTYTTGAPDPRLTFEFIPAADHHLFLHAGLYHQYYHKVALIDGGLPADFFIPANATYTPECAHTASLKYQVDFLNRQFSLSTDIYFKQLKNVVESTNNIFALINSNFDYEKQLLIGDGRNYGWNVLFQRNRGKLTGTISYSLAWARRKIPELEGREDYAYAASYDRRHDLNVVLNWQVAPKWNLGATFVCASGLPYTAMKEAYLINGKMVCLYSQYNGAQMPTYHRLDVTCSYDIIKKNDHLLGINLSIYNVYNQKNAQFVVYRGDLQPIYGCSLSTILPSISIYGRW